MKPCVCEKFRKKEDVACFVCGKGTDKVEKESIEKQIVDKILRKR